MHRTATTNGPARAIHLASNAWRWRQAASDRRARGDAQGALEAERAAAELEAGVGRITDALIARIEKRTGTK